MGALYGADQSGKRSSLLARIHTTFPQNPTAVNIPKEAACHYLTPPQDDGKKQDQAMAADLGNVAWELGEQHQDGRG